MKRFEYKLSSMLLLRENATQRALEDYGQCVANKDQLQKKYESIESELIFLSKKAIKNTAEVFCVGDHVQQITYIEQKKIRLQQTRVQLDEAQVKLNEAHQAYLKAKKEEDVLLKHKDRMMEEHQKKILLDEEKLLQELTNARKHRKIG